MAHNTHKWGRHKARERYSSGGAAVRTSWGDPTNSNTDIQGNQGTAFYPRADFDDRGIGKVGPSLGESQTDEIGAERRYKDLRGGEGIKKEPPNRYPRNRSKEDNRG